jgi:hypothetical protein
MFNSGAPPIINGNDWFVTKPALHASAEWQNNMTIIMVLCTLGTFYYAFKLARAQKNPYPYFIALGAGLAAFYEPLGDLLAHVTYAEVDQINYTTTLGFRIPLWCLFSYFCFFGFPVLMVSNLIDQGISVKRWMLFFFLSVASAWLFEVPIINSGATEYFGANQPYKILNYPVWMGFVNACTMFCCATAVHYLKKSAFIMSWPAIFLPLMPMLVAGANVGAALPLGSAINASTHAGFVSVMATASILLSTFYVWVCGGMIAYPAPSAQKVSQNAKLSAAE